MKWKCTLTYIRQQESSTFHQTWWLFSVVVYSAWCSSNRLFSFCVVCVCERFLLLFVFFVSIDRLRALCKWCYSLRLMRVLCVCCVLSIPNHQIVVHILLLTMVRWCGCLPVLFWNYGGNLLLNFIFKRALGKFWLLFVDWFWWNGLPMAMAGALNKVQSAISLTCCAAQCDECGD